MGGLAEERFAVLVNLGKKITDFGHDQKAVVSEDVLDETHGVNVQFEDSDEDEDEDAYDEVREDDDEEEEEVGEGEEEVGKDETIKEPTSSHAIHAENLTGGEQVSGKRVKW